MITDEDVRKGVERELKKHFSDAVKAAESTEHLFKELRDLFAALGGKK